MVFAFEILCDFAAQETPRHRMRLSPRSLVARPVASTCSSSAQVSGQSNAQTDFLITYKIMRPRRNNVALPAISTRSPASRQNSSPPRFEICLALSVVFPSFAAQ